jgi:hypothetical protein
MEQATVLNYYQAHVQSPDKGLIIEYKPQDSTYKSPTAIEIRDAINKHKSPARTSTLSHEAMLAASFRKRKQGHSCCWWR